MKKRGQKTEQGTTTSSASSSRQNNSGQSSTSTQSTQSISSGLSTKVTGLLKDQLEYEKLCVDKYTEYSQKAQDPELSQLLSGIANSEKNHYNSVHQLLNGTIPNMSSSSSAGNTSGSTGNSSTNRGSNNKGSGNQQGTSNYSSMSNYNKDSAQAVASTNADFTNSNPVVNPLLGDDGLMESYTANVGLGDSIVNQNDGNMSARSYTNTIHPDDLVIGSGGASYGSYGLTSGGPTQSTTNSTTNNYYSDTTYATGTNSSTSSNSGSGQGSSKQAGKTGSKSGSNNSGSSTMQPENITDCDQSMCHDLLMTEKHISSAYNTAIFECTNTQMRDVLNHIQKEEQQHGEKIFNYMQKKGWYQTN